MSEATLTKKQKLILENIELLPKQEIYSYSSFCYGTIFLDRRGASLLRFIRNIEMDISLFMTSRNSDILVQQTYSKYGAKKMGGLLRLFDTARYLFMKLYPELAEEVH